MDKSTIIKTLREMAKHPTVTLPRDCEILKAAADLIEQAQKQEPDDGYCKACDGAYCTAKHGCVAISNPPPQRQPLTDDKFYAIARTSGFDAELMKSNQAKGMPSIAEIFGRAIEAAHGIKEKNTEKDGNCKHCTDGCPACDARRQPNVLS
jgi:hypothetical protein